MNHPSASRRAALALKAVPAGPVLDRVKRDARLEAAARRSEPSEIVVSK